ncbi:MAG TPA: hypothetical protein VHB50_13570 [Bryobacteraceae bacterium]|nr:hypothetical protein [Bryobacteraceae bacterium]
MTSLILLSLATSAGMMAQTSAASSLSGTWVLQKDNAVKLTLQETGDKIHVQETKGGDVTANYTCNLDGKDCSFKEEGHAAKVSLWFNGPKLVELRTRGNEVTKRRFTVADDGKSMEVEVLPISTPGKGETLAYSRQ